MNRRSFLRAAVVFAPAVILTPSLLMRVRPLDLAQPMTAAEILARRAEMAAAHARDIEWAAMRECDYGVVQILNRTNVILHDMGWIEANLPQGHVTTVRVGLPSTLWRSLYEK